MDSMTSFGIDFIIRKSKADVNMAYIFARITCNGQRSETSIKEQSAILDWDSKSETVKGRSLAIKQVNQAIEDIRYRIKEKYRALKDRGEIITAESIKNAYLGVQATQRTRKLTELLTYFEKIWKSKMKHGGFKNYETTIAYLKLFLASQSATKNLLLTQVNVQVATDFEHYVRHNPVKAHDPCLGNGIAKHIQRFKRIVNWAVEIEWLQTNPIAKFKCPIKKSKRKKLSFEQLVILENKMFADPSLQMVKEMFLASCYTGFAFADIMALAGNHFEFDDQQILWCRIYRAKTDGLSPVPILKSAESIIEKYKNHPLSIKRNTIFPLLTNQYVNRCLKIIKGACELDLPLTFHIARHTFAKTVALKNGIPLETVQMMMGHKKISTTQIYAEVDEEKIIEDMSGLESKLDVKRLYYKSGNI